MSSVSTKADMTVPVIYYAMFRHNHVRAVITGDTAFRREVVELLGALLDESFNHNPGDCCIRQVMEYCTAAFLQHAIAAFNVWNMLCALGTNFPIFNL